MGQPGRVLDQAVGGTEAHGRRKESNGLHDDRRCIPSALHVQRDHRTGSSHLPKRTGFQILDWGNPRIIHPFHSGVIHQPVGQRNRGFLGRADSNRERLQAPVKVIGPQGVKYGAGCNPNLSQQGSPFLIAGHDPTHGIPVTANVFRRGVNDECRAERCRILQYGGRKCGIHSDGDRARLGDYLLDIDQLQCRIRRCFTEDQSCSVANGLTHRIFGGPRDVHPQESTGQQVIGASVERP